MKRAIFSAACLLWMACAAAPPPSADGPRAVILFIGDGMGVSQVTLGRLLAGGPDARLTLDTAPVTGFRRTHSANSWVTDSAAAATALATGRRTSNFAVGVDEQGRRLETALERARARGWATGLVTTARITYATPAAFAAHVPLRAQESEVARQYCDAGVDVLLGGGARFFPEEILARFREHGYTVVRTAQELAGAGGVSRLLGLFAEDHIPYVLDRDGRVPSLPEMTRRAIEILAHDPDGFFLMVEGGRIDMACHASDAPSAAHEMLEFDEAVRVAVEWARGREDVRILVTADHATGGMALTEKVQQRCGRLRQVRASAEQIAAFAVQALPEHRLADILREQAGIGEVDPAEIDEFYRRLPNDPSQPLFDAAEQVGAILSRACGVSFIPFAYRTVPPNTTHGHDGAMVPVYAWGHGAERFGGTLDIDEIGRRLLE